MSQGQATMLESHIHSRFNVLKKLGSGAYGHVWKVEEKSTKKVMALKKNFDAFKDATDAQRTYREIEILRQAEHPNIIKLFDMIRADNNKDVYLLFEYMEADLHNVISEGILKDVHVRFIIYQLSKALKYLHSGCILHRDLKPSNILINSNCTVKLCDFGLVRSIQNYENSPVLTEGVATRWYRAPEVLLGSKHYSTPADIWSFGCIIYEILAHKPLFAGNSTLEQIEKICAFTGYPSEEDILSLDSEISKSMIKEIKSTTNTKQTGSLNDFPVGFKDLLEKILIFNPKKRLTIDEILEHPIVKEFYRPEELIVCNKVIRTSIDDNRKFSVDEYRKMIYGSASNQEKEKEKEKVKQLSNSFGGTTTSQKYIKFPKPGSSCSGSMHQLHADNELTKKYTFEKMKTQGSLLTHPETKKIEKTMLKYVRSAKDINNISKNELMTMSNSYKTELPQQKKYEDAHNREEIDVTKPIETKYNSLKQYSRPSEHKVELKYECKPGMSSSCGAPSSIMINPIIQTSWKSPKGGNQTTIAPKSTLFKSVKYINMNPSNNLTSMPVSAKYEAKYMPMTKFDNRRET